MVLLRHTDYIYFWQIPSCHATLTGKSFKSDIMKSPDLCTCFFTHRYRLTSDGTLIIKNAIFKDAGIYGCLASNAAGTVKDTSVLVYIGKYSALPEIPHVQTFSKPHNWNCKIQRLVKTCFVDVCPSGLIFIGQYRTREGNQEITLWTVQVSCALPWKGMESLHCKICSLSGKLREINILATLWVWMERLGIASGFGMQD